VRGTGVATEGKGIPEPATSDVAVDPTEKYVALRQALLGIVPAGIFWADATGSCTYVNDQFCEITGRARDELLGFGYLDAIHLDDRDRLLPEWRTAIERGEQPGDRLRFTTARDDVWASIRIAPVAVRGHVLGYLATAQDLTPQIESEQIRRESEVFLRAINDRAPIGICMVDIDGTALTANPRAVEILGSDPTGRNLVDFVLPEDLEIAMNTSIDALSEGRTDYGFSVRFPRPDGTIRWADVHCQAILDDDGEHVSSVIAVIDTTDVVEARRDSERYAELLAALTDFVALCDPSGRVTYLNRVAEINAREIPIVGIRRLSDFFDTTSRGRLASEAWPEVITSGFWQGELTLALAPGITTAVSVSLAAHDHADGERTVSVVARDIADIKAAQRALEVQATHDPLTGLPNRALLFDRVSHALERSRRSELPVVLMFVDLDGFKEVNDQHGHDAGDEVLRGVSSRLLDVVRVGDTVARIGGDEFVILSEGLPDQDVALRIAERIVERVTEPFGVAGSLASIGASVGVAFAGPASTVAGLVKQADVAVYEAKRTGKGRVVVFDDGLRRSA
jgi:diguanylate cyclase (GGDEF)-like protein/PAS domain S-box-containing protein